MKDFYITYHGSVEFDDGWIILPKGKTVYLYNIPGYIYCSHLDFSSEKIQEIEPILKFGTGDLIFNPTFGMDEREVQQANEKKHCRNRIANTTGIYKPKHYVDYYTSCVEPELKEVAQPNRAFTLSYIINHLPDVNNIHIYTCLPFEDNPLCKLPFNINKDLGLMYYDTRRITNVNNKDFTLVENDVGLTSFQSIDDIEDWLKTTTVLLRGVLSFIKFGDTNQFSIINLGSIDDESSQILQNDFEHFIVAPQGNIVSFKIDNVLSCLFKIYILVLFQNPLDCTISDGGIYDSVYDREITNIDEIIENFKPINVLEIINNVTELKINKQILDQIKNGKIRFSQKDICEFFDENKLIIN